MKRKLNQSQFILISHKINLFGEVNSLIGVFRDVSVLSFIWVILIFMFFNLQNVEGDNGNIQSKTASLDLRSYDD